MSYKSKICLVTVFNHNYEKNVEKLEKLNKKRFSDRYYLMPFYQGSTSNIISVYDHSHRFYSYYQQGLHRYYQEQYSHYVFVADDLILNSKINQHNICDLLDLQPNMGYIKFVVSLHKPPYPWHHTMKGISAFKTEACEYMPQLPAYRDAVTRLQKHHIDMGDCVMTAKVKRKLLMNRIRPALANISRKSLDWVTRQIATFYLEHSFSSQKLPYPVVRGYSDFIVVPAKYIKEFCHYCGVFASIDLFAEIAVPTALLLVCEKIRFEQKHFRGVEYWKGDHKKLEKLVTRCNANVNEIFKNEPSMLYFHPIKLSEWQV